MADEAVQGVWFRRERLDGFVDAAFAFATTALVISAGSPPQTLAELRAVLPTIPAFAGGFAIIAVFWWAHYEWSKVRPSTEGLNILLSLAIVFTVLIYVFPLKILTGAALHHMSGRVLPGAEIAAGGEAMRELYLIYGGGFAFLSFLYVLLFAHAARQNRAAGDAERAAKAASHGASWTILCAYGAASALLAAVSDMRGALAQAAPGMLYATIPLAIWLYYGVIAPRLTRKPAPIAEEPAAA